MVRIFGVVGLAVLLLTSGLVWAQGDALQRKAELVDRMLKESDTSRRIAAKGGTADRALLDQAGQARDQARQAMVAGDEKKAVVWLNKALSLLTTASRTTVDPASRQWLHRARYEDLLVSVVNFKDAYNRHLKRLKDGAQGPLDMNAVETLKKQAMALGQEKKFFEANKMLEQAQGLVVEGLKSLLGSASLVYELKFDTPKDEYEYELRRGESYEAMIRMILSDAQKNSIDASKLQPLMDQSQEFNQRASQKAAAGEHKAAIKIQEGANEFLAQALRLLGVMIPL